MPFNTLLAGRFITARMCLSSGKETFAYKSRTRRVVSLSVLALLIAVVAALSSVEPLSVHPEPLYLGSRKNISEEFREFCHKFNKTYSAVEYVKRQAIYAKKVASIALHNAKYKLKEKGWKQDINQFADETLEEFLGHLGYHNRGNTSEGSVPASVAFSKTKRFDSVDWNARGKLGRVKNQGRCGSCWAFGTTGTVEACVSISTGLAAPSLSEQQLQDCMFSRTCSPGGGGGADAIEWVKNNGIVSDAEIPYTESDGQCHGSDRRWRPSGRVHGSSEDDLLRMVGAGPVLIGLNADLLQTYSGGVIDDAGHDKSRNHAVIVTGWTTDCAGRSDRCWILRNSWGEWWGEKGFFRVVMGQRVIGLGDDSDMPTGCTSPDGASRQTEYGPIEMGDRWGGDLPNQPLQAGSAEECQSSCFYNDQCNSWAYNTCGRECWLKGSTPGAVPANCRAGGIITAQRRGGNGARQGQYGPIEILDRPGKDMDGNPRIANSAEDCQSQCARTKGCNVWAFDTCGSFCWFKWGDVPTTSHNCRASGVIRK
ncbi:cathepsin L precursor [Planoprotostelium fungivorum]|uniref:Cathepsin L n=1 Tax=Planoprotostelium fungivorum TaxID=1890364 RepID=A0A2P6NYV0_9EUKA|nr:cathepsin L precursor [Planoprotostelium fungivorum]